MTWTLLTWRGRFLGLTGIALVAVALTMGQRDLFWWGCFLIAIVVLGGAFVRWARPRLHAERTLAPAQVSVGSPLRLTVRATAPTTVLAPVILLTEQVPVALGNNARLAWPWGHSSTTADIALTATCRGRHQCGPLRAEIRDPLGLARVTVVHDTTSEALVTPVIEPLRTTAAGSGLGAAGESTADHLAAIGDDDVVVREYRHGDDVRRIHWRSSAKHDDLMVRREEQALDPSAIVLLDSRAAAHAGVGTNSSFERAVSVAASTALHLLAHGYRVAMLDAGGEVLWTHQSHDPWMAQQEVLEYSADIVPTDATSLDAWLDSPATAASSRLIVAVLGAAEAHDIASMTLLRSPGVRCLALALLTEDWGGSDSEPGRADLQADGWTVRPVTRNRPLRSLWGAA